MLRTTSKAMKHMYDQNVSLYRTWLKVFTGTMARTATLASIALSTVITASAATAGRYFG
jgi:hypothetical protein